MIKEKKQTPIGEELRFFFKETGGNPGRITDACGVSKQAIMMWANGETRPSPANEVLLRAAMRDIRARIFQQQQRTLRQERPHRLFEAIKGLIDKDGLQELIDFRFGPTCTSRDAYVKKLEEVAVRHGIDLAIFDRPATSPAVVAEPEARPKDEAQDQDQAE